MLYDVNLGIRDYFTYTDAMLNNSLFSDYLKSIGMKVYKGESTRDIVCLDFDFGSRSYDTEIKRLKKLYEVTDECDKRERLGRAIDKVQSNEHKYSEMKRDEIRNKFYTEGVSITYITKNKDGSIKSNECIHYKMLYRTSAKAKLGQVIFINEELYEQAYDWLTIGIGKLMPIDNAKIVEMSAYAPLTTSTIVGRLDIPVEDILILKDQDSLFSTIANVVKAEEYDSVSNGRPVKKKRCVVVREERQVKNTLWDGMGIIESSILPNWINGMALLRNHMFKMCGFRGHVQKFFVDWCYENGKDYYTYQIPDMFGNLHYVKDIKIITTDNAIKWKKFMDLMGNSPNEAYHYWCNRINADGSKWGVVKTDHASKLGNNQQMSYQMINTLPCTKDDVREIAQGSIDYVELLKVNNREFEKFLRANANEVNHYDMMADLYNQNPEFGDSTWFRNEKKKVISEYVFKLRNGKIAVNADNLTICGNPYALLLHSVGEDWNNDPTFSHEDGCVQCYTRRFDDGEYLAAIRSPHNSPNNMCYLHNVYSEEMERYFSFSNNIIAVNCINTDIQDRANGMDEDSDFFYVTDHVTMVKCAETCYREYHTIVNDLKESGLTYSNTPDSYALMDNRFSKSRLGIGWSSNLAMLAMTYYWTECSKEEKNEQLIRELHDNFVILSVLAQVLIDSCKRSYEIDGMDEVKRIQKTFCMKRTITITDEDTGKTREVKHDYPIFMKYTKDIPRTKDGKELSADIVQANRYKLNRRIDETLVCPMNWLEEWLDKIQGANKTTTIPTENFFVKFEGRANHKQMSKIMEIVEDYDNYVRTLNKSDDMDLEDYNIAVLDKTEEIIEKMEKIKIGNPVTINRLVETALGLQILSKQKTVTNRSSRYARKILNLLYKTNKEKFLSCFIKA